MGWLNGWGCRKSHVINPASGAGTDYPIRITVHYGSGTDSGEHVYLNGKCRTDFGDIRFTRSDGETLLDYFMESKTDGDNAVFWVKIPDDLSTNPVTIYIYYNNPNATRADDPHNIDLWQLREHQTLSGYYPNFLFSKPTASVIRIDSYTNGASSLGEGYVFIIMSKSFLHGKKIQVYWNGYLDLTLSRPIGKILVLDTQLNRKQSLPVNWLVNLFTNILLLEYDSVAGQSGWMGWRLDISNIIDLSSFTSDYVTLVIIGNDGWTGSSTMLDVDYIKILDANDNVIITYDFDKNIIMEVTNTYEDYGIYRKYISPEPSHGEWSSEETTLIEPIIPSTAPNLITSDLTTPTASSEPITILESPNLISADLTTHEAPTEPITLLTAPDLITSDLTVYGVVEPITISTAPNLITSDLTVTTAPPTPTPAPTKPPIFTAFIFLLLLLILLLLTRRKE